MMRILDSSLALLTVMFLAFAYTQDLLLMTECLDDLSDCPSNVSAQYPVCGDCAAFFKCAGAAQSARFNCPSGLLYDVGLGVCQYSSMANTSCEPTTTTTANTTTTEATSTTSPTRGMGDIPGCINSCEGHPDGLYPSCKSCHYYFTCFDPPSEARCLGENQWDQNITRCIADSSTCFRTRIIE